VTVSGYFEADIGRWTTDDRGVSSSTWATQVGLTPVIRLQSSAAMSHWFAEVGVGANYILPCIERVINASVRSSILAITSASGVNLANAVSTSSCCGYSTSRTLESRTRTRGRTLCSFNTRGDFDRIAQRLPIETTRFNRLFVSANRKE